MTGDAELEALVRLYDLTDLPRLERCVFSLVGQGCGPLRVHLLLQRFSFIETQAVRAALQPVLDLDEALGLTLHNWEHPEPSDPRVPLLNLGARVTHGRYLTCLEVGDVLLPGACATLLARLRATGAVAAFGGMAAQRVAWWGDIVQPHPAHGPRAAMPSGPGDGESGAPPAFLLDRTRLPAQELVFLAQQPGTEIVDFLRRICASHPVDGSAMTELLGLRQVPA